MSNKLYFYNKKNIEIKRNCKYISKNYRRYYWFYLIWWTLFFPIALIMHILSGLINFHITSLHIRCPRCHKRGTITKGWGSGGSHNGIGAFMTLGGSDNYPICLSCNLSYLTVKKDFPELRRFL